MTLLIVFGSIAAYCVCAVIAARWIYADFIRENITLTEEERKREAMRGGLWGMLTTFSVIWPALIVLLVCFGICQTTGPWLKKHIGKPALNIITGPGKRILAEHEGKKREEISGD